MNFRRGSRNGEPEINLIPLIDVVLVIIIFLMLTTTFSKVSGLEIKLPTAEAEGSETEAREIVVAVTAAGEVLVNRQAVGERSVEAIAAALGKSAPADGDTPPVVVINADARTPHQSVVDVMQAAQRAGHGGGGDPGLARDVLHGAAQPAGRLQRANQSFGDARLLRVKVHDRDHLQHMRNQALRRRCGLWPVIARCKSRLPARQPVLHRRHLHVIGGVVAHRDPPRSMFPAPDASRRRASPVRRGRSALADSCMIC